MKTVIIMVITHNQRNIDVMFDTWKYAILKLESV